MFTTETKIMLIIRMMIMMKKMILTMIQLLTKLNKSRSPNMEKYWSQWTVQLPPALVCGRGEHRLCMEDILMYPL